MHVGKKISCMCYMCKNENGVRMEYEHGVADELQYASMG